MNKRVNLYHLYTATRLSIGDYRIYEKHLSNRLKISNLGDREKGSLFYLVDLLLVNNCQPEYLKDFYNSYTIPHIGKEFDLLKISNDKILNIELKSENVGLHRIKEQLVCNYKYLKYLSKESYLFTFVSDSKTFYKLENGERLVSSNVEEVVDVIKSFDNESYPDIDGLFKTGDFLVSPNVNPEKFVKGQYFLTTQQEYIKNKLLKSLNTNNLFKITGEAGTGKTLLLFDIALSLLDDDNVLIINCNKDNSAHKLISNSIKGLNILSQKEVLNNKEHLYLNKYILLDEAQRMNKDLWNILLRLDSKIIFSLDPKQVITKEEIKSNFSVAIDKLEPLKFKLSNRIRINNSIKDFTYRLFDLKSKKHKLDLSDVNLHFASTKEELDLYFKMYNHDFTYISIPDTSYHQNVIDETEILDVVGKDYENVLMVIDDKFFYEKGILKSYNSKENDYLYLKILYQGLSRTREKITLIIYRNKGVFKEILNNIE